MAAIGAPVGAIAGMAKLVSVGSEFQREMSNVAAFVTATDTELQKLSDTAESLGATTAFTAANAANAMSEMGKAGLSANQILGASEGVLTLAAAGDIEMAEAAKIAAAALNQFGIPAAEMGSVVDRLAKASSSGSISLSGMGTQLSYAAASAKKAGMGISETSAIVASLATTMGEDKAGTGFRAMMNSITSPTAVATAEMDRLGIKVLDANKKFLPFPQMIENFNSAMSGMSQGDRAASLGKMFTTIGDPAISKMLQLNGDAIRSITESVANSDGFGLAVAEKKLDNVTGAFQKLQSAASAMAIDIFQTLQGPLQAALEGTANFISGPMVGAFATAMEWMGAFGDVATFAWNNFSLIAGIAIDEVALFFVKMFNQFSHLFGTNFMEVVNWLGTNWSTVWRDMLEVTLGVMENIGKNVRSIMSGIWETIKSLGKTPLTFDMVPLMEGIKTTTAALELTPRVAGAIELGLESQIVSARESLGGNFDQFLEETTSDIGDFAKESAAAAAALNQTSDVGSLDYQKLLDSQEDIKPEAASEDTSSAPKNESGESPLGVALKGSKEAFDVINKAIKGTKDAHQKTIAKESEKQTKLAEKQVALLEGIADETESPEVISLA